VFLVSLIKTTSLNSSKTNSLQYNILKVSMVYFIYIFLAVEFFFVIQIVTLTGATYLCSY